MAKINIVLHEPEIPQNTGNIARTCAATGASLHLLRPMGFEVDDKKLKRAGLDYWDKLDITYYDSYEDFLTKRTEAVGNTFYFSTLWSLHFHVVVLCFCICCHTLGVKAYSKL